MFGGWEKVNGERFGVGGEEVTRAKCRNVCQGREWPARRELLGLGEQPRCGGWRRKPGTARQEEKPIFFTAQEVGGEGVKTSNALLFTSLILIFPWLGCFWDVVGSHRGLQGWYANRAPRDKCFNL